MREAIYKPTNTDDGVIVQYTDSFILDKGMKIPYRTNISPSFLITKK